MSPINLSNVTRVEIGGIDLTSAVSDVNFGGNAYLPTLADATVNFSGYWDTGLTEADLTFTFHMCQLTPASRYWFLKVMDPKRYARLRRMRYETRRRRKHR